MDCITFNKDIDAYLSDRLDDEELNDFLNHLRDCKSCAEELEVNYIVHEGIVRLEDGKAGLNLVSAFRHDLGNSRDYMSMRKKLAVLSDIIRTLTFWVLAGTVFVFLRTLLLGY